MGKKLFFLSLVVLSFAMGQHWYTNRPKTEPRNRIVRPRTAISLEDLNVEDTAITEDVDPEGVTAQDPDPELPEGSEDDDEAEDVESPQDQEPPEQLVEQTTAGSGQPADAQDDEIMKFFLNLSRDPFEISPFAKMQDEARIMATTPEDGQETGVATRTTTILPAPFTGTIETDSEILAIIDQRLYREGDDYDGRRITKIERNVVTLENPIGVFFISKRGVNLTILPDGSYEYSDEFYKFK